MSLTELSGPAIAERLASRVASGWRTRFAPAPTGKLHLGHAVNAVFVWGLARACSGRVIVRIEDHDRGRCRPEFEQGILTDLEWLGLVPDPDDALRGVAAVLRQSDRPHDYEAALATLSNSGNVYACICSRREIAAGAQRGSQEEVRYPGTCRQHDVPFDATAGRRVMMQPGAEPFDDLILGAQSQDPAHQCGDVLVRDRNGYWTYQFAVAVDDLLHGIDVVIRGADLLESTGRQIRLARLLGREEAPCFAHHPLLLHPDGSKLSKSLGDTGIAELRAAGWTPSRVLGEAALRAGLQTRSRTLVATDLPDLFTR